MKNFLIKNWKTNILALIGLGVLVLYVLKKITTEQLVAIQGFIVALGLCASKDANTDE